MLKGKAPSLSVVAGALLVFGVVHTLYRTAYGELPRAAWHLGAEYFNIAQSIADGQGFSDPFGETTGPTAWMPPLLPGLYALLLVATGSKWGVMVAAVAIAQLGYVVSGTLIYSLARRFAHATSPVLVLGILACWELVFHYWYVELTSDIWLVVLLMTVLTWLFLCEDRKSPIKYSLFWGILGGLIALGAPALAAPWVSALLWLATGRGFHAKRYLTLGTVALVLMLPWTMRNMMVFDKFVPTKSNLGYEFYQTNVLDRDGVHDLVSMQRHPFNNFRSRFEYAAEGETSFVASRARIFTRALKNEPLEFLRRVHFRAQSALVLYHPLLPLQDPGLLPFKRTLHLSAPLLLFTALFWGRARAASAKLALLWLAYLAPYIIVAFYARYSLPLLPIYVLSSFVGVDALRLLWRQVPASGERDSQAPSEGLKT